MCVRSCWVPSPASLRRKLCIPAEEQGSQSPFPKGPSSHPSTDRQPPKDSISCACSYLVPGLRMGKRLLPVQLPAEHAVVQPAQGGDSCHMPHPEIILEWHQGPSPTFSISSPNTTLRSEGISGMQAFPLQSDRVTTLDRRYLWS